MKGLILVLFLFATTGTEAQNLYRRYRNLSRPEKCWVITHPFIAKRALAVSLEAREQTATVKALGVLDTFDHGGRLDAFRHTYWMARLSSLIRPKAARRLGKAHEKGNYLNYRKGKEEEKGMLADSLSCVMDLLNNEYGIQLGRKLRGASASSLSDRVIQAIRNGELKMLLRDKGGRLCTCDGVPVTIPVSRVRPWTLPYCMITTREERFTY